MKKTKKWLAAIAAVITVFSFAFTSCLPFSEDEEKSSGGNGGGSYTRYTITIADDIVGGTVTAHDNNNYFNPPAITAAGEYAEVYLRYTENEGYLFAFFTVTDANGESVRVGYNNEFTMPASNVTVHAAFSSTAPVEQIKAMTESGTVKVTDFLGERLTEKMSDALGNLADGITVDLDLSEAKSSEWNSCRYSFSRCTALTSVTIGDGVRRIPDHAFRNCKNLTSMTIGSGVTYIGSDAFDGCSSLESIRYTGTLAQWCAITFYDSLYFCNELYINNEKLPAALEIPSGTTKIGYGAFRGTNLTSVTIPDSVTEIGSYAFYDCDNLTSVTIGSGVTEIGGYAFYGCTSLASVTIPDSVTEIGKYAFYGCDALTSVTFANTTGWHIYNYSSDEGAIDVSNPATNASELKSSSYDSSGKKYHWGYYNLKRTTN